MRTSHLTLLVAVFLAGCGHAYVVTTPVPAPAAGDRIRYAGTADTSEFVYARLVSIDPDSLVFERFVSGWGKGPGVWARASLPTGSVGRLQVRIGRRANTGRGTLIGLAAGGVLGVACAATTESGWMEPTPEQCLVGYTLMGAGTGFLIGALSHGDVWAPSPLPRRKPTPVPGPVPAPVSAAPLGIGVRIAF
jgi:hypothetical protein